MQRFKSIILKMQGHNKKDLHLLYNTLSDIEPPKIYEYSGLKFWFGGTSWRTSEKLLLYVGIPGRFLPGKLLPGRFLFNSKTSQSQESCLPEKDSLPQETYLLRILSPAIARLSESYVNNNKSIREKAQFEAQEVGGYMVRRSGMRYDREQDAYILRMNFNVPLVNALSVNAKAAVRAVRDILDTIETALKEMDSEELERYVRTYEIQCRIRKFMKEHDLCAFIGDGSILPRESGTEAPMQDAVPFVAPEEMAVWIPLADSPMSEDGGGRIRGMGIQKGVTVITGGGYSGKSTLLDAIEMGIYNHVPGDGREFVLTDDSALKIYAEDGRPVSGVDLSPFFRFLPGKEPLTAYTTPHASGSVSQAAGIIEAVCGKCRLLLIDEDKSATNFMIRDKNMRYIVKDEPIIPFTDRVRELYGKEGVSTILVIGGSSEYLACADAVLLMSGYRPEVITEEVRRLGLPHPAGGELAARNGAVGNVPDEQSESAARNHPAAQKEPDAQWSRSRRVVPRETAQPFLYFRKVETENEKKIILDEYTADITLLTALISGDQLNTLACVMERLLTDKEADGEELLEKAAGCIRRLLQEQDTALLVPEAAQRFYEEIRPLDAFCCANRMRGLLFRAEDIL